MKKSRILSAITAAAIAATTFVSMAMPVSAADSYHAYIGVQSASFTFRDAFNNASTGLGTEYFNQITANYPAAPEAKAGTLTDVEITGDGTYTVSVTDFDFGADESLNLLFVSTDVPLNDAIKFTDVKVKMDGNTKHTFDDAFLNPDEKEYFNLQCINIWNPDIAELFGYVMPTSSIEIEFTVTGMDALLGGAADTTDAPADTTTTAPTTGNVPAAVMLSVMAVAATAAVVSKKRN
ncbi:MAG: hypothetical protein IJZ61_01955 [Oscillospiraceae bacterium]|nr:hypothetical protein [Oscillospiraceae bacterium]